MPSARALALQALQQFERGRIRYLREQLDAVLLPPREHAFAGELAYGVLRHRRFLDHVLGLWTPRGLPDDLRLRVALRLGAHQLLFVPGMPPHAAVHETVALLRQNRAFVNAVLRRLAGMIEARAAEPSRPATEIALSPARVLVLPEPGLQPGEGRPDPLALRHSLPDFLVARWRAAFGARATDVCAAASARPELFLRNCALRCDVAALRQRLQQEGVQCADSDHGRVLRWQGGESPLATACFRDGWFVVQDPTAVRAAEAVPVSPGGSVLDLCAAPGTKATLLAEGVTAQGVVYAHDRDAARLQRVRDNAARLQLPQLRAVDTLDGLPPVDAVLVDAPCSNTGVVGRRVEVRWRLRPDTFSGLAVLQRELLQQALQLVRPGGSVVYSTCSIEAEENGELVRAALPAGWTLQREQLTLPAAGQADGGYFAVLRQGTVA